MNGIQDFTVRGIVVKSFFEISGSLKDFFYITWFPSLGLSILYVLFGLLWGDEYGRVVQQVADLNVGSIVEWFWRWDFILYFLISLFIGFWANSVTACLWLLKISNKGEGLDMFKGIVIWNDKIKRVFLLWVGMFFIMTLAHVLIAILEISLLVLLGGVIFDAPLNSLLTFYMVLVFHFIFGLYMWSRLSFVYPASITSSPISFYKSWQMTESTGLVKKVMLVIFVSYVLVGFVTFIVMGILRVGFDVISSDSLVLSLFYFFLQAESSFFMQFLWLGGLYYIYERLENSSDFGGGS